MTLPMLSRSFSGNRNKPARGPGGSTGALVLGGVLFVLAAGCAAERLAVPVSSVGPNQGRTGNHQPTPPRPAPPPILSFPRGSAQLESIRRKGVDPAPLSIPKGATRLEPVFVEVEAAGDSPGGRTIILSGWSKGESGVVRTTVWDRQGRQRWMMEWGLARPGKMTAFESAPGAELTMSSEEQPHGRILEQYRLTAAGKPPTECRILYDPFSEQSLDAGIEEFRRFWVVGTPLDDNVDGHLAMSLFKDEGFSIWAANQLRRPPVPYTDISQLGLNRSIANWLCAGAGICTFVKCHFGGPLNPVCDACGTAAAGCALADLFGWL